MNRHMTPAAGDAAAMRVFRRVVGTADYPCLGARSVLHRDRAAVRGYEVLGSAESARLLLTDLADFAEHTDLAEGFASFVAVFFADIAHGEMAFERLLWRQLRAMRAVDPVPGDPAVADDPAEPEFSFSACGTAYFVIGLHPDASRQARRAPHPMLVFNPHEQFDRLRAVGSFTRMRDTIRRRDEAASGSVNPMVADHGAKSEACQYSGRLVGDGWRAPFAPIDAPRLPACAAERRGIAPA